jgi:hypothetical protein
METSLTESVINYYVSVIRKDFLKIIEYLLAWSLK